MTPISFCIPTRNNYKYIKFAYDNIRICWPKDTELILLDDFSSDETWNWMNEIKKTDTFVKIYRHNGPNRIGHCVLYDMGAQIASNEIFGIFHADMIPTKNYITNILKHIKPGTIVSGTRIEPLLHPPGPEKISIDFGLEPENFELENFNNLVNKLELENKSKTTAGVFAPWACFKEDFLKIGGHDKKLFAPMELEDSDLFFRFLLSGYTLIQSRDAFVYHMTCRGSRFKDGVKIVNEIPLRDGTTWKRPQDSEEYTKLRGIKFKEWWRKWHSDVLNDENMLPIVYKRYNIDYIIHNINFEVFKFIEPWADNLYIDSNTEIIDYMKNEQNNSKFDLISKVKEKNLETISDIVVEFDARGFNRSHIDFIKKLSKIIETSGDIGEFELDIFKIRINSMNSYENTLIKNEDFYKTYNIT